MNTGEKVVDDDKDKEFKSNQEHTRILFNNPKKHFSTFGDDNCLNEDLMSANKHSLKTAETRKQCLKSVQDGQKQQNDIVCDNISSFDQEMDKSEQDVSYIYKLLSTRRSSSYSSTKRNVDFKSDVSASEQQISGKMDEKNDRGLNGVELEDELNKKETTIKECYTKPKTTFKIVSKNDSEEEASWFTDQELARQNTNETLDKSCLPHALEQKKTTPIISNEVDCETSSHCSQLLPDDPRHLRAGGGVKRLKNACCGTSNVNLAETARPDESSAHLIIAKKNYFVNRNILIKYCEYFKSHPEIHSGIPITVALPLSSRGWRHVYIWLTTDSGTILNVKNITGVYDTAKKLGMPKLQAQCVQFVNEYLNDFTNDPIPLLDNIRKLCDEQLYTVAHQKACKLSEHLFKSIHFLNYRPDQVTNILKDDLLAVKSEKSVFDVAVNWLTYKWPQRSCDVSRIMSCVRFGLMTEDELLLCTIDTKGKCVLDTPFCQTMLLRAFQYLAAVDVGCQMMVPHITPKPRIGVLPSDMSDCGSAMSSAVDVSSRLEDSCNDKSKVLSETHNLDMIAGEDFGNFEPEELKNHREMRSCRDQQIDKTSQKLDVTRQWRNKAATKIQSLFRGYRIRNTLQDLHSAAMVIQQRYRNNQNAKLISPIFSLLDSYALLVFGRNNIEQNGDILLRYDVNRNRWEKIMQTKLRPFNYAATLMHNKIYITGGLILNQFHKSIILKTARYLDLTNAKWKLIASMLTPRMQHSLLACNNKLYAVGGFGARKTCLSTLECYDPGSDSWSFLCPMPKPKAASASVVYRQHLWICGGVINLRDNPRQTPIISDHVDCYDVLRNYWYKQTSLPVPLCYALAVVASDTLFIIGGRHTLADAQSKCDQGISCRFFAFDYLNEKWLEKEQAITPRCKLAGAVVDKYLYIVGGVHCAQSAECYCFNTRQWMTVSKIPLHISNSACILIPPRKTIQIQIKEK